MAAGYGDFIIFYTGAQIINDGKSKDLFKVDVQNQYQARFDVPQLEWPLPFNHAPYELLLLLPLAHLSYPVAHAIWSGLNLLLLVIMLGWLLHYVHSPHRFFIGAAVLAWFPTMEAFRLGQDSILSAALLLTVFIALKHHADGWAGIFLAVGLYKPQLVLPMAGAFLVARRWKVLIAFGITGGILTATSVAMVGWQGIFDLLSILRSMADYSFIVDQRKMANIRGLSHVLLQGNSEMIIGAVTVTLSLGVCALCLYLWRGGYDVQNCSFDLKFSLTIVSTILISYHLYSHDLFPLMIALVLFFRHISSGSPSDWVISSIFFFLLIIFFLPVVPRYLIEFKAFGWGAIPVLALYAILSLEIFRRRRLQEPY
jgi:hypothetical protein